MCVCYHSCDAGGTPLAYLPYLLLFNVLELEDLVRDDVLEIEADLASLVSDPHVRRARALLQALGDAGVFCLCTPFLLLSVQPHCNLCAIMQICNL